VVFDVKIGVLLPHENVIINLKISRFLPQHFQKMFGFWRITQKILKVKKNASNKVSFQSTFQTFSTMTFCD